MPWHSRAGSDRFVPDHREGPGIEEHDKARLRKIDLVVGRPHIGLTAVPREPGQAQDNSKAKRVPGISEHLSKCQISGLHCLTLPFPPLSGSAIHDRSCQFLPSHNRH